MQAKPDTHCEPSSAARWVAVSVLVCVAMLAAMAWLGNGDALFVTLVQQGLAWCF